ncbi:MAG: metalloregulator ArsR/SmtB family transcription factor [Candidatus Sumerlaeota bacterium]|nr:metalloregulator ArsR/SmtB family transcription factor [Candidatus Sumerlaeota bacterium]
MDAKTLNRLQAHAQILKALAHPTRLFIVEELAHGERCVCALRERIGADMSTVSKHLALLKSAGLVDDEKRGSQVFYRLRLCCVSGFLDCAETVARENVTRQLEMAR